MIREKEVVQDIRLRFGRVVRIRILEIGGRDYADVRLFFENENGGLQPTKRGVTFPKEMASEVVAALRKAFAKMLETGREN